MDEMTPQPGAPRRLASIDAYRGTVMLMLMAEALEFAEVSKGNPDSPVWKFLDRHQTHVDWGGLVAHDMIQPSFSFLVGAALTFSLAGRKKRGERVGVSVARAAWRAFVLVLLGVFLRSIGKPQTNFTFEDTLSQIGLGYLPLFLLGLARPRVRWVALGVILLGYWAAFAAYPVPGPGLDRAALSVPAGWAHDAAGLGAHWNKNANLASDFDRWFLNLFPRARPFTHNGGGYATLSFIPTLATMLLGLIAGDWIRAEGRHWPKIGRLVLAGVVSLALGMGADYLGLCPSVKRIWTPSWVLVSGGICFLLLAASYAVIDAAGLRAWSYPLRVIGMNSIAAYVLVEALRGFIEASFRVHLGEGFFKIFGPGYEPLAAGAAVLAAYWLVLLWMDRRGLYLRV